MQLMHSPKYYVVYWNNIPSPYIVDRFNALANRNRIDFEAWFNDRIEPDRSWKVDERTWRFRYRYLPTLRISGRRIHFPLLVLGRRPDLLVSLYAEPSFLLGWTIARLRGTKTAFWCEVTWDTWVQRRPWKEWLKRTVLPSALATIGPGEDGRAYAMRYGVPAHRALSLMSVIDVDHYANGRSKAWGEREMVRTQLGLKGTTFMYAGRLWGGKGITYLLEAFSKVESQATGEVSLLIVGDGLEEARLRQTCQERGIRNVVFAGFHQKPEMPRYYAMADVFVFPTLGDPYGLVVDEAMACSLPVISTSAAGEIRDRVEEDVNGYIVPPGDSALLADRMLQLARDPNLRERMGKISAKKIAGRTPERWAEDFEQIVDSIVNRETVKRSR
jgi:glycosyltransferase involved in cell wall biosynthesis